MLMVTATMRRVITAMRTARTYARIIHGTTTDRIIPGTITATGLTDITAAYIIADPAFLSITVTSRSENGRSVRGWLGSNAVSPQAADCCGSLRLTPATL